MRQARLMSLCFLNIPLDNRRSLFYTVLVDTTQ